MTRPPPSSTLFPYTTLFRSLRRSAAAREEHQRELWHRLLPIAWLLAARPHPSRDRKSTRLNSSHTVISYAVFCLKKKKQNLTNSHTQDTNYESQRNTLCDVE